MSTVNSNVAREIYICCQSGVVLHAWPSGHWPSSENRTRHPRFAWNARFFRGKVRTNCPAYYSMVSTSGGEISATITARAFCCRPIERAFISVQNAFLKLFLAPLQLEIWIFKESILLHEFWPDEKSGFCPDFRIGRVARRMNLVFPMSTLVSTRINQKIKILKSQVVQLLVESYRNRVLKFQYCPTFIFTSCLFPCKIVQGQAVYCPTGVEAAPR